MAKKSQSEKFRDKARELEADESVDKFDPALRKIATAKPDPKTLDGVADMIGQSDPSKGFGKRRKRGDD
ncbi:MAG: hypothetical protein HYX37_06405 [Rhizobiales bacterium]|nr:hypothetical protein [Hyphomicrobiales bacterium]